MSTPIDLEHWTREGLEHGSIEVKDDSTVCISAGPHTDWFFRPDGTGRRATNVPKLSQSISAPTFSLSAQVHVDFGARYDAGALWISCDGDETWAKIAFEYSAAGIPTIVSVVTRGTSDDADGPALTLGDDVYLRLYTDGRIVAFHFSLDGKTWKFVRLFTLPRLETRPIKVGLGAQSPTGDGVLAEFTEVKLSFAQIGDFRDGS